MAIQTTYRTSYGSRVKSSVKNIMFGVILLFVATGLLWWNEGRAVKTTAMLKEAESVTVEMPNPKQKDPKLNGKMVHATAYTSTPDTLTDQTYGYSGRVLKLKRKVEYYQWEEEKHEETHEDSDGGTTTTVTYEYHKKWVGSPISSSGFHEPYGHVNIAPYQEEDYVRTASYIDFGAYVLSSGLKEQLRNFTPAAPDPSEQQIEALVKRAREAFKDHRYAGAELVHVNGDRVYVGGNGRGEPNIGDVRITFSQVSPGDFSVLAVVNDVTFKPYVAKNEYTLERIRPDRLSAEEMYKIEHTDNAVMTWGLRFVGFLLMIFAIKLMFSVFYMVLKIIPFVGKAAEIGVGIVSAVLGACWSLIVIGTAWVFYRPLLGLGMFAVVVLVIILASTVGMKKKSVTETAPLPDEGGTDGPPPAPEVPAAPQQFAGTYRPASRLNAAHLAATKQATVAQAEAAAMQAAAPPPPPPASAPVAPPPPAVPTAEVEVEVDTEESTAPGNLVPPPIPQD